MGITQLFQKLPPNISGFERAVTKPLNKARITLESPILSDLQKAAAEMMREGVPKDAMVGFHQWNKPKDNYYLIATWPVDGDRQP